MLTVLFHLPCENGGHSQRMVVCEWPPVWGLDGHSQMPLVSNPGRTQPEVVRSPYVSLIIQGLDAKKKKKKKKKLAGSQQREPGRVNKHIFFINCANNVKNSTIC